MGSAIRVLQAADLNLHEPLESVGRLPALQREIFNQARESAALKVFETALQLRVDLLLLTGPLADFDAEPRLACFLMEQFRRLQAGGVCTVWATCDTTQLPSWSVRPTDVACLLPGEMINVFTHAESRQIRVEHSSGDRTLRSSPEVDRSSCDLVISVSGTGTSSPAIELSSHNSDQKLRLECIPVQRTGLGDSGLTGMRLVNCPLGERPTASVLPTAAVTWRTETIDLAMHPNHASLMDEIARRSRLQTEASDSRLICVEWILSGVSPLWEELVSNRDSQLLLQEIRNAAGRESRIWNWKVHLHPSPEQYRLWSSSPAIAEGLLQFEQLSTADFSAAASVPGFATAGLRGPILTHHEFRGHRIRLVRELRQPEAIAGTISSQQ
ncbi:hypothetical protein SH661x_004105 [Planctomicrobium sp. SH661]|uniref:hypothetical protein n=1 Tax=Planctomicrobium sp. SH661 TaxID=3448124 RepID=UPI003F5C2D87